MADAITFKVVGLQPLMAKLKRMERTAARKALRKGLRAGQKILTAAAKAAAPVKTGALRRAIKTRAMKRKRWGIGMITQLGEKGWYAGDQFYGAFQEFGWHVGKRGIGKEAEMLYAKAREARRIRKLTGVGDREAEARRRELAKQAGAKNLANRPWIEGKHFMERSAIANADRAGQIIVNTVKAEIERLARG